MKIFLLIFISLLFNSTLAYCQSFPFWENLTPGPFQVGYKDTIIIKQNESYNFYNYKGGKPFFISMWYPAENDTNISYLKQKEYWNYSATEGTQTISDSLKHLYKEVLKDYGICTNHNNLKTIKFRKNQQGIFDSIIQTQVFAKKNLNVLNRKFPCIIYHHGAGGSSDDNTVFCEYLASQGWVVISSNYHWPIENEGLANYHSNTSFDFCSDVKFVSDFAASLQHVDEEKMVYSGHSAGGQIGLFMNSRKENPFKLFLLYDMTIEWKSKEILKQRNPLVDSLLVNHSNKIRTPTIMITSPQEFSTKMNRKIIVSPSFNIFRELNDVPVTFITAHQPIAHDNFISQGTYRSIFIDRFKQKDAKKVKQDYLIYHQILQMTNSILSTFLGNESENYWTEKYNAHFKIEIINKKNVPNTK